MSEETQRSLLKAERRKRLLKAAAGLFAERGFRAVSIDDLGAAVGVSGPAVYRHFPSKEAILTDLLVGVSRQLFEGGANVINAGGTPLNVLHRLVAFHTEFALTDPDLIRVQDRDFADLPLLEARRVRRIQRAYTELWVGVLLENDHTLQAHVARTKVHATFGLINSTPHSARDRDADVTRRVLEAMAIGGLLSSPDWAG